MYSAGYMAPPPPPPPILGLMWVPRYGLDPPGGQAGPDTCDGGSIDQLPGYEPLVDQWIMPWAPWGRHEKGLGLGFRV